MLGVAVPKNVYNTLDMLAGPAPSKFLALEGGRDEKLCPLI